MKIESRLSSKNITRPIQTQNALYLYCFHLSSILSKKKKKNASAIYEESKSRKVNSKSNLKSTKIQKKKQVQKNYFKVETNPYSEQFTVQRWTLTRAFFSKVS